MTVRINKDAINLREKLSQLDKPSGLVGEELLRADTSADAREALNLEEHLFEDFESTGIDDNATSTKVTVSDSGVDVTGTVSADGLTVGGLSSFNGRATFSDGVEARFGANNNMALFYSSGINNMRINSGVFKLRADDMRFTAQNGTTNKLIIANNGDVHFYEDTGTTAKMVWDSSAESLGIGTASPSTYGVDGAERLVVGQADGNNGITISSYNTSKGTLAFNDTTNATVGRGYLEYNHNGNSMTFGTNAVERMRIDSSGNVGIGTASPSDELHVKASFSPRIRIDSGITGQESQLLLINSADGLYSTVKNIGSGLGFTTQGAERARIDSSGNLLVGTTNTSTNCKLKVSGAVSLDSLIVYTKAYGSLDTIGQDIAGLGTGFNGASTFFEFTGCGGGIGGGFKILFNCYNASGVWNVQKEEVVISSRLDIEYLNGVFTFKSKSGSQAFSPRVKIECYGSSINSSYFI